MTGFFGAMWQGFWFAFTLGTGEWFVPLAVLVGLFIVGMIIGVVGKESKHE